MLAPSFEHLGQYGSLVKAMRDELEGFVANDLRRHLAIAERDRYVLTSIHVDSTGADDGRRLLERFCREFTPEQIKQYLAKEVIARLPNASAIDLSQFAGLNAGREAAPEGPADDDFEDLMNELRDAEPAAAGALTTSRSSAAGRRAMYVRPPARRLRAWPIRRRRRRRRRARTRSRGREGVRRVTLTAVPGRHYIVGKDATCDIPVEGVYASRRHCELWMEHGAWWTIDSGSTNGIRVEPAADAAPARSVRVSTPSDRAVLEVPPGAGIVLTASARGDARQYPRLVLRPLGVDPLDLGVALEGCDDDHSPRSARASSRRWHPGADHQAARRLGAAPRGPLAQPDARDRLGARERVGPSRRHRRGGRRARTPSFTATTV
jgi:hypothetical protein